jgi:hypothetical protein
MYLNQNINTPFPIFVREGGQGDGESKGFDMNDNATKNSPVRYPNFPLASFY